MRETLQLRRQSAGKIKGEKMEPPEKVFAYCTGCGKETLSVECRREHDPKDPLLQSVRGKNITTHKCVECEYEGILRIENCRLTLINPY